MTSPGSRGRPIEQVGTLGDADAEARHVELVGAHQARMLGGLAADERAAGQLATGSHAADELGHVHRIDPADGQVVEEQERPRTVADDVVGAHRDEVPTDGLEPAHGGGDGRLGTDAVGRADEDRLAHAGGQGHRAGETAQAADQLDRAERSPDVRPQQLHRPIAGLHVDAGRRIGAALRRHRAPATGSSSSTNLCEATS